MKETFTNSFAEMSDVELNKMASAIRAEMERRLDQKQEQKWNAVKKAIKDYINEFGSIELKPQMVKLSTLMQMMITRLGGLSNRKEIGKNGFQITLDFHNP